MPAQDTRPPLGLQGWHRAARDAPPARPGPPSLCDPSGSKRGQAQPAPPRAWGTTNQLPVQHHPHRSLHGSRGLTAWESQAPRVRLCTVALLINRVISRAWRACAQAITRSQPPTRSKASNSGCCPSVSAEEANRSASILRRRRHRRRRSLLYIQRWWTVRRRSFFPSGQAGVSSGHRWCAHVRRRTAPTTCSSARNSSNATPRVGSRISSSTNPISRVTGARAAAAPVAAGCPTRRRVGAATTCGSRPR